MKAYHVDLTKSAQPSANWSADPATLIHRRKFELLTHMYSCINHKTKNPDVPLALITDDSTLKYYDQWQLTGLYDEVITDFFDDYPHDRIAKPFWTSPKIWAMSKLSAPFVIFDTDLMIHRPLSVYAGCDLLYLHRDTPAIYPHPLDIEGPPGVQWDDDLLLGFRSTLPMTCAVSGMYNEEFKRDFVDTYFQFVLDATGQLRLPSPNVMPEDRWSAAQLISEQWLMAALAHKWQLTDRPLRTRAVAKVLWMGETFRPLDPDQDLSGLRAELTAAFYRLWGAKQIQNEPTHEHYPRVRDMLLEGRFIVENSPQYAVVKDVYEQIIAGLTGDPTASGRGQDLKTVFESIYESGTWGKDENNQGTSGSGSTFENSENYFRYLKDFLKEEGITSVVDVGCGDWQVSRLIDWAGISYTGYDASGLVVAKNTESFAKENIRFIHDDFLEADLPAADLLIVKDVFQHLSLQNIRKALTQFPKFKYVIVVNDVDPDTLSAPNVDIPDGGYRTLDISAEPFNLQGTVVLTYELPNSDETKHVFVIKN